ncbi:MAG TPA: hypothetical protein VJB16_07840, partial [archaeon]|nr:hypothetical protein [archaeon]
FALSGLWQYPLSRAAETARVLRAVQSERVSLAQLAEDAAAPDTFPELQKLSAEYDQERALAERFDAVLVRSSPADLRRLDRELPGGARLMADYRLFFTQARRVFERRAKDGDLQAQVILEKCY